MIGKVAVLLNMQDYTDTSWVGGEMGTYMNEIYGEYIECVRECVIRQARRTKGTGQARGTIPVKVKKKPKRDKCVWYDNECKQCAIGVCISQ